VKYTVTSIDSLPYIKDTGFPKPFSDVMLEYASSMVNAITYEHIANELYVIDENQMVTTYAGGLNAMPEGELQPVANKWLYVYCQSYYESKHNVQCMLNVEYVTLNSNRYCTGSHRLSIKEQDLEQNYEKLIIRSHMLINYDQLLSVETF